MSGHAKSDIPKGGRGEPRTSPERDLPDSPEKSPDANEALPSSIKSIMNKMCTDNVNKLDSIIAESVKREITVAISPLESKLGALKESIADLERLAYSHSSQLVDLKVQVCKLTTLADYLSKKYEDLEAR